MKKDNNQIFTVLAGGVAGAGARSVGTNLGMLVNKSGYEVFASVEYPSLIRGGHNICRFTFSDEPIHQDYRELDVLIALDEKTIEIHKGEMKKDGVIFFDGEFKGKCAAKVINIPSTEIAKKQNAPLIAQATPMLGAVCFYFGLDMKKLAAVFKEVFGAKAEMNVKLAKSGYDFMKENSAVELVLPKAKNKKEKRLLDGSVAVMEGMSQAGLKAYVAYPMTPATPMLHYAAKAHKDLKIKVVQAENEIAVATMAAGMVFAGCPTAVGSSGGGFALMTETLSLAGIAELPVITIDAQRCGPATGVATRQAQADLNYARHTIGEFPRLVLAPGDMEEAYLLGAQAVNLAWNYQMPTIILTDKHIAESLKSSVLPKEKVKKLSVKKSMGGEKYGRYKITPNGVTPLAFPGAKNTVVKANSYEHVEDGTTTEDPNWVKKMFDKRYAKMAALKKEMKKYETIKVYGDKKSKNVVLFWGSTKGAVLEALKHTKKSFKAVQVLWMNPLDEAKLKKELLGARRIVGVEGNYEAQFCGLMQEQMGVKFYKKILRYDSSPFSVSELTKQLAESFK